MPHQPASQALARFRVLDLTRVRAGPTCVRQLADWGADVIKIEQPPDPADSEGMGGPRDGPDFQNLHRNKRAITLNLKTPEGLEIFMKLVEQADVVAENYRPDVKTRLGVDYEALKARNPKIILASISGFGQDGPYARRPGFDQIAQGMGGLMSITGAPGEGPMRVGIPVADLCAGLLAAMGVLTALLEREVSGEGQWVQSSLLQAQTFMLDFQAARWLMDREVPKQAGNNLASSIPSGVFATAVGHINVAASGQVFWQRLCKVLGESEVAERPWFATCAVRSGNRDEVNGALGAVL
jgi:formyl-CoA transferase